MPAALVAKDGDDRRGPMHTETTRLIQQGIRNVPDFPKPGIQFKDITPLLKDGQAMRSVIEAMARLVEPEQVEVIVSPEARGFLFGAPLSVRLGCGFVPVRKPGKLPHDTTSMSYDLEYGTDSVEVHSDAILPGARVLLVDDVLATGGTMEACAKLTESLGGVVSSALFLIELSFLDGRARLKDYRIHSLLKE